MSIFRRQQPASPMALNPADGRQYEAAHLPNQCYGQRYSVFWTGKTLDYGATDATGVSRVVLTDGSWADLTTGEHENAGPGEIAVSRIAGNGEPW